jgi:predicted NBD/HSP70 family sugar kinase
MGETAGDILRKQNKLTYTVPPGKHFLMRRSAAGIREALGAAVLELRRRAAASRSSLSEALGIAASTGGLYVDLLIDAGYVTEAGFSQGAMGRPRRSLALRPEAGWFAGVEFHAARVQAVRVDFAGQPGIAEEQALPPGADAQEVVKAVGKSIEDLAANATGPLLGIGVGAPGVIDPRGGISREYRYIAQWRDVAVEEALRARFSVPVALENNLRTIALAERWFGGGTALDHFVCLGLRSGVGAGIVMNGQLVCGSHHAAGEVGNWPWPFGNVGERHDLQSRLSAPAIYRRVMNLRENDPISSDLREVFAQLAEGFRSGSAVSAPWEPVVAELAQFVACLHLLLNPSAFFLHGPLTALGGDFCEAISTAAHELSGSASVVPLCLLPSKMGDEAGALGAAGFAMERWQPPLKMPA